MLAEGDPQSARSHNLETVHTQQIGGSTADRCQRQDFIGRDVPGEMFIPNMLMRMKQRERQFRSVVNGGCAIGFVAIAHGACQAKVVERRFSAGRDWAYMFDFERDNRQSLGRSTVRAAFGEVFSNATSQFSSDVLAHALDALVPSRWIV